MFHQMGRYHQHMNYGPTVYKCLKILYLWSDLETISPFC